MVVVMSDEVIPADREDPSGSTEAFRAYALATPVEQSRKPLLLIASIAVAIVVALAVVLIFNF